MRSFYITKERGCLVFLLYLLNVFMFVLCLRLRAFDHLFVVFFIFSLIAFILWSFHRLACQWTSNFVRFYRLINTMSHWMRVRMIDHQRHREKLLNTLTQTNVPIILIGAVVSSYFFHFILKLCVCFFFLYSQCLQFYFFSLNLLLSINELLIFCHILYFILSFFFIIFLLLCR